MRKFALWLLCLPLVACQATTTDPYTRQKKTSNAVSQSVQNAVTCGTISLASGLLSGAGDKAVADAAVMAALCAGAGALSGYALDEQEKKLLAELEAAGVKVEILQKAELLSISNPIVFAANSTSLSGESLRTVNAVGKVLRKYNRKPVDVIGHTSSVESDSVGMARANSVAAGIRKLAGNIQIEVANHGSTEPLGDEKTQTGVQRNRRVGVFIRLTGSKPIS